LAADGSTEVVAEIAPPAVGAEGGAVKASTAGFITTGHTPACGGMLDGEPTGNRRHEWGVKNGRLSSASKTTATIRRFMVRKVAGLPASKVFNCRLAIALHD
jgi:hypothetical protein